MLLEYDRSSSFLLLGIIYCMNILQFIHLLNDGHLDCFQFRIWIKLLNILAHDSLWTYMFLILWSKYLGVE